MLLGYKWYKFFPQVGISALCSCSIIIIGSLIRLVLPADTWVMFFVTSGFIALIGLGVNMMIVLNREERKYLIGIIRRKLHI